MSVIPRLVLAAATVAVIGFVAFTFIETKQNGQGTAVEPMREPAAGDAETRRDARKKARAAVKQAVDEECPELRADFAVWEDYLDKKTRRKLQALIAKCEEADSGVSAEP